MNEFKLIIAGGRDFNDAALMERVLIAMADTEYASVALSIVSGMARGADMLGYQFAKAHNIKCYEFPADWDDITVPGAVVRLNKYNKPYNVDAGYHRNTKMGIFADGLLAFWNGSNGTGNMIARMKTMGKPVTVIQY